uniref:Retrovirus-related Pol polyprotein from transposon TNT 1-94 n=1 Tax=Nicotiana tabacum TaxID=4097 RepID=A0A1S3Y7A2_TOBAC
NSSAASISANINSIPVLNGTNFKEWKENIMIVLGCMDLDLALRIEQPASLGDTSSSDEKKEMEKWERSNRMSLMIMKRAILESFRGTMNDEANAKVFLENLVKRFEQNEKAETSTLLSKLVSMRYKGKGNIREYTLEMSHLASKLKSLKLVLPEELLVYLVLISLPAHFNQFKVSYNCLKEKWTLNELISHCVQEEERIKQDKTDSAHLASSSKDTKKRKGKEVAVARPQNKQHKEPKVEITELGCFFCKGTNHMKKYCTC